MIKQPSNTLPKAIYEPRGMAREYAALACNLWLTCSHGCTYCYASDTLHKRPEDFYIVAPPRDGILEALAREAPRYSGDPRRVLLCFLCDAYQPDEDGFTRQALLILCHHQVSFQVLTKGGHRAIRDFDCYANGMGHFGTTLLFTDDDDRKHWEPNAASVEERIEAIKAAHGQDIYTWVSIEPVISPQQALDLIPKLSEYVDEWRVGKLNHHPYADTIDWAAFALEVSYLLRASGKHYLIKDALAKYLPPGTPQRYPNEPQAPFLGGLFCEWPQNRTGGP